MKLFKFFCRHDWVVDLEERYDKSYVGVDDSWKHLVTVTGELYIHCSKCEQRDTQRIYELLPLSKEEAWKKEGKLPVE